MSNKSLNAIGFGSVSPISGVPMSRADTDFIDNNIIRRNRKKEIDQNRADRLKREDLLNEMAQKKLNLAEGADVRSKALHDKNMELLKYNLEAKKKEDDRLAKLREQSNAFKKILIEKPQDIATVEPGSITKAVVDSPETVRRLDDIVTPVRAPKKYLDGLAEHVIKREEFLRNSGVPEEEIAANTKRMLEVRDQEPLGLTNKEITERTKEQYKIGKDLADMLVRPETKKEQFQRAVDKSKYLGDGILTAKSNLWKEDADNLKTLRKKRDEAALAMAKAQDSWSVNKGKLNKPNSKGRMSTYEVATQWGDKLGNDEVDNLLETATRLGIDPKVLSKDFIEENIQINKPLFWVNSEKLKSREAQEDKKIFDEKGNPVLGKDGKQIEFKKGQPLSPVENLMYHSDRLRQSGFTRKLPKQSAEATYLRKKIGKLDKDIAALEGNKNTMYSDNEIGNYLKSLLKPVNSPSKETDIYTKKDLYELVKKNQGYSKLPWKGTGPYSKDKNTFLNLTRNKKPSSDVEKMNENMNRDEVSGGSFRNPSTWDNGNKGKVAAKMFVMYPELEKKMPKVVQQFSVARDPLSVSQGLEPFNKTLREENAKAIGGVDKNKSNTFTIGKKENLSGESTLKSKSPYGVGSGPETQKEELQVKLGDLFKSEREKDNILFRLGQIGAGGTALSVINSNKTPEVKKKEISNLVNVYNKVIPNISSDITKEIAIYAYNNADAKGREFILENGIEDYLKAKSKSVTPPNSKPRLPLVDQFKNLDTKENKLLDLLKQNK